MIEEDPKFYTNADEYWQGVEASVDGMLGGLEYLDDLDAKYSLKFLDSLKDIDYSYVLDCGAGIGRVTKNILSKRFEKADLVERSSKFLNEAKVYLKELITEKKVGELFEFGLQEFKPQEKKYSVIWSQWVLGHLTDDDMVAFFQRCVLGLKDNGLLIIKENLSKVGTIPDEVDSSITRDETSLKLLFEKANLKVIKEGVQPDFPKELFKVKM